MSTQLKLRRDTAADLAATTPARGEPGYDLNNRRLIVGDGVQAGGIPHASYRDVQAQAFSYGETTPVGNEYRLDLDPPLIAYKDGVTVVFKPTRDSQGPASLNVNGLGTVPIRKIIGATLVNTEAGDLQADQVFQATYVNGFFQLLNREAPPPQPTGGAELITSGSLVGTGLIDIRSIPQDYSMLMFHATGIRHARSAGDAFVIRGSNDNGVSFHTSGTWGSVGSNSGNLVSSGTFSENAAININATIFGYQFGPRAQARWVTIDGVDNPAGHSARLDISVINALRVQKGSGVGSWTGGSYGLYGIR